MCGMCPALLSAVASAGGIMVVFAWIKRLFCREDKKTDLLSLHVAELQLKKKKPRKRRWWR